jgi:hypothetical protein
MKTIGFVLTTIALACLCFMWFLGLTSFEMIGIGLFLGLPTWLALAAFLVTFGGSVVGFSRILKAMVMIVFSAMGILFLIGGNSPVLPGGAFPLEGIEDPLQVIQGIYYLGAAAILLGLFGALLLQRKKQHYFMAISW